MNGGCNWPSQTETAPVSIVLCGHRGGRVESADDLHMSLLTERLVEISVGRPSFMKVLHYVRHHYASTGSIKSSKGASSTVLTT